MLSVLTSSAGDGMVSLDQGREAYGVALDEQTHEFDGEETVRLGGE